MSEFPDTSASLIERIKDPGNSNAWLEFESIYRPVVFRIARAKGLQYADAVDLVQQVLQSVAFAIDRYEARDEGPGFRNWLSRVTRNAVLRALTRQPKDRAAGGSAVARLLSVVPVQENEIAALLQLEFRRELFGRAAEQVRKEVQPATWLAFEMTALENHSVEKAAQDLDLSVGSIYAARSRIMRKIKQTVADLEQTIGGDQK